MYPSLPRGRGPALVAALLPLLALALAGCSGGKSTMKNEVTGVVSYKGTALPGGSITFYSKKDSAQKATALIGDGGKYTMPNAPEGDCKISVQGPTPSSDSSVKTKPIALPPKYLDPDKSGLSFSVGSGKQEKNFDLP